MMRDETKYYDRQRLAEAGVTDLEYDCGLWWYPTPKGRMACPPFVQNADDLERYFRGSYRDFSLVKRRIQASKVRNCGHPAFRPVEALDPDTLKVVASYPSIGAAADAVGCAPCTISNACRAGRLIKGTLWRQIKPINP